MYRLIDEEESAGKSPWHPVAIFWGTVALSVIFPTCIVLWVGGMVWFAANWGRLQQPRARLVALALILMGVFAQAHLIYFFFLARGGSLTRSLLSQLVGFIPIVLLIHQLWTQQTAFHRRGRGNTSCAVPWMPLSILGALGIGWTLLFR